MESRKEGMTPADCPVLMIVLNDVEHDNRVLKCAKQLRSLGHPLTIFGVSSDRGVDQPAPKMIDGVLAILFPNPRFQIRNAPSRALNWEAHIAMLAAAMSGQFDQNAPAILHTHDFNTLKIGRELLFRAREQGRHIYWVHDLHEYVAGLTSIDDEIRKRGVQHQDECIRIPDQLITVSPHLADAIRRDYRLRIGPAVILNSNGSDSYNPHYPETIRKKLGLSDQVPLAVYTGGVAPPRGVHTLVETLPLIPEMHVALVTNNSGDYVNSLKYFAERNGCASRLHITPYVPPDEVPSFIQDATVGVHPMVHFENAEVALPNKLFDYCIARVPCVVSDCKAMGDFVRDWGIGEVFCAEDVEDLARALRTVFTKRIAYTARLDSESSFVKAVAWESQCQRLAELYERARSEIRRGLEQDNWAGLTPDGKARETTAPVRPVARPAAAFSLAVVAGAPRPTASSTFPSAPASPPEAPEPVYEGPADYRGALVRVDGLDIVGWAADFNHPGRKLKIEAFYREEKIGEGRTGLPNEDASKEGGEIAGFRLTLPMYFLDKKARRVTLRVAGSDIVLAGTPRNIAFDPAPAA